MPRVVDQNTGLPHSQNLGRKLYVGVLAGVVTLGVAMISHHETPIRLPQGTKELVADKPGERKFLPPEGTADQLDCGGSDVYLWLPPTRTYHKSVEREQIGAKTVEFVVCGTPTAQIPQQGISIQIIDSRPSS